MKHLCWDSFMVGFASHAMLISIISDQWGYAAVHFAAACFFSWAADYRAKLREEEKNATPRRPAADEG